LLTAGGNAREIARAKNQKKQAEQNKGKREDGLTLAQRRERDAAALRAKQEVREYRNALTAGQGKKGRRRKRKMRNLSEPRTMLQGNMVQAHYCLTNVHVKFAQRPWGISDACS